MATGCEQILLEARKNDVARKHPQGDDRGTHFGVIDARRRLAHSMSMRLRCSGLELSAYSPALALRSNRWGILAYVSRAATRPDRDDGRRVSGSTFQGGLSVVPHERSAVFEVIDGSNSNLKPT
eukprot:3046613-Pyramimonas_sp.AAC.2